MTANNKYICSLKDRNLISKLLFWIKSYFYYCFFKRNNMKQQERLFSSDIPYSTSLFRAASKRQLLVLHVIFSQFGTSKYMI